MTRITRPAVTVVLAGLVGALGLALGLGLAAGAWSDSTTGRSVVVRAENGDVLAEVPLRGRRFAVSYRNSIYGTLAESRYQVAPDGRFRLVQIAADQRAVIEEYYAITGPRRAAVADRRTWVTAPSRPAVFGDLTIAATDLGERTLHVPGHRPVAMWRLVERNPVVVLDVEESS